MPASKAAKSFSAADSMLTAFATSNRVNIFLIQNLPDEAWRAERPGGKGRDIASIAAHIHNVRLMWLKSAGKTAEIPQKLEGGDFTPQDAIGALKTSFEALDGVLRDSFATDGRIKGFKPDVGSFLGYLIAHDAHRRGQISMLARLAGHPLSQSAMYGMWEWGTR